MDTLGRKAIVLACATACAAASTSAGATVVYDSPGTFFIQTPLNDNILITNGQAAVFVADPNGVIRGPSSAPAARVQRGTLELVANARIVAAQNQSAIYMIGYSRADVRIGGASAVHGAIASEGHWLIDEATATQRLYVQDDAVVSGNIVHSGYLRLQGRAVVAGNIASVFSGSLGVDIAGGFVGGSVSLGGLDYHTVKMTGGTIWGSLGGLPSYVDLDLSGGYIHQGLRSRGAYEGVIRGGRIDGGVAIANGVHGGSHLSVRGGRFETVAGDWLFAMTEEIPDNSASTLKICGGQFGYHETGSGLLVDGKTDLHVYGSNLAINAGRLQGTLQDGSSIDVALTFGPNWTGTFTLNSVPTPSTPNC
jgi:hypothetical protein